MSIAVEKELKLRELVDASSIEEWDTIADLYGELAIGFRTSLIQYTQ